MNITALFSNVRFYVLLFSSLFAGFIYWSLNDEPVYLIQSYALLAITYLYFTLLASPVTRIFTFLPYRGMYLKARRALGVSAFLFALLHGYFAFNIEIGGFAGLSTLSGNYLFAVSLGSISLTILFLMAATAFDAMVNLLTFPKWKMLHRMVYVVAVLVTTHAMLLGSHFADLSGLVPMVFFVAGGFLLILEVIRFIAYLKNATKKVPENP